MHRDLQHAIAIRPPTLYFGTPVALITTLDERGSANITPMSSAWALGYRLVLGLAGSSQGCANLLRSGEAGDDDEDPGFFVIEMQVLQVHAHPAIVLEQSGRIDSGRWSPLLYVFRHYFGTGERLGRNFSAES